MEHRDSKHWRADPHQHRGHADIKAETHNRRIHDGEPVAAVRTFQAQAIGALPRQEPPIQGEEVEA